MVKLTWSPRAFHDLDEICDFIARDSARYAYLVAEGIVSVIESIPVNPLRGAIVPEYNRAELRERSFQNYRIVYRVGDDRVEIVTIVHAARQLPSL
jgi:plasmid stabilization system protein ParE